MNKNTTPHTMNRRTVLKGAGTGMLAAASIAVLSGEANAAADDVAKAIKSLTGGDASGNANIDIKLPEIAENGASVPVTVSVDSPMDAGNYVKAIHLMAEGNPSPEVASFYLTSDSGKAEISTRIRLGKTQNVVAAVVMSNGTAAKSAKEVKVTIGGCGG